MSVVLNFLVDVYKFLYEQIDDFFGDIYLIKGALLLLLWGLVISSIGLFIFSFWYDWKIPVGIIIGAVIIEALVKIGKNF